MERAFNVNGEEPGGAPVGKSERRAYAKINLTLNVTGKRPDGYHEIETIMQAVSLCDDVSVTVSAMSADCGDGASEGDCAAGDTGCEGGDGAPPLREHIGADTVNVIRLTLDTRDGYIASQDIPADARNTAYGAAQEYLAALAARAAQEGAALPRFRVDIRINKRIPAGAGLAGGSADAAATLLALNEIFNRYRPPVIAGHNACEETPNARTDVVIASNECCEAIHIPDAKLAAIALRVGADVPFCMRGGTALAAGVGELLTPLTGVMRNMPGYAVLLANPRREVSTRIVYENYSLSRKWIILYHSKMTRNMVKSIRKYINGACEIGIARRAGHFARKTCFNVLEKTAVKICPQISAYKKIMIKRGAACASMSGSGATVFALFREPEKARAAAEELRKLGAWTALCGLQGESK